MLLGVGCHSRPTAQAKAPTQALREAARLHEQKGNVLPAQHCRELLATLGVERWAQANASTGFWHSVHRPCGWSSRAIAPQWPQRRQ
jgi:hypothetical protein